MRGVKSKWGGGGGKEKRKPVFAVFILEMCSGGMECANAIAVYTHLSDRDNHSLNS